jgi:hypothetical protein
VTRTRVSAVRERVALDNLDPHKPAVGPGGRCLFWAHASADVPPLRQRVLDEAASNTMTRLFLLRAAIDDLNLRAATFSDPKGKIRLFEVVGALALSLRACCCSGGARAERPTRRLDTLWIYHHNGVVKLSQLPVEPCLFVRPSRRELKALPEEVRGRIGHALYQARCGQEPV